MKTAQYENSMAKLLALGVPLVSVFILTGTVTDPVNVPKLLVLGGVGFSALALFLLRGFQAGLSASKSTVFTTILFIVFASFSVIASNLPISQNLYGVYGRNTGFLTYLFLAGVLLGSLTLSAQKSFRWLLYGLFFAGLLNIAYCGWVVLFGDFVGWSNPYGNILGLFGNPNFIGAFLGIWVSAVLGYFLVSPAAIWKRLLLLAPVVLAIFEIYKSHAVQGVVVSLVGFVTVLFFYLRSKTSNWIPVTIYVGVVLTFGITALFGALQKGPLAQYVYKNSVSLRGSYWDAGIQTGLSHPLTGVGMDGFGDWYRKTRSIHAATIMPGPNVVTNSAHNVVIDIFTYGGFPLLVSYLSILIIGAAAILKGLKVSKKYDPIFVALSVGWIGYQLQSLISINQIGLAVWGWAFTGALIAYQVRMKRENSTSDSDGLKHKEKRKPNHMNKETISSPLIAGLGIVVGLILACPPISADMAWVKAMKSSNLLEVEKVLEPSYLHPRTSSQLINSVGVMENSKLYDQAHKYALIATEFNPENFDSWYMLYVVKNSTDAERALALKNMKRLDPNNPDVTKK